VNGFLAMSITVSVIDSLHGRMAGGVTVRLESPVRGEESFQGRTGEIGQLNDWQPPLVLRPGVYRVEVDIDGYYATLGIMPIYPRVIVMFRVLNPNDQYHMPILITPYSQMIYIVR
jgi:5-hydroxyisourate hydrolase